MSVETTHEGKEMQVGMWRKKKKTVVPKVCMNKTLEIHKNISFCIVAQFWSQNMVHEVQLFLLK